MTEDEQLLEEYTKEIHGKYYTTHTMTVAKLIESHRHLRNLNLEWIGAHLEAQKEGYDFGYKQGSVLAYQHGLRNVQENTITLEDLRKMTLHEIANLIGTDD